MPPYGSACSGAGQGKHSVNPVQSAFSINTAFRELYVMLSSLPFSLRLVISAIAAALTAFALTPRVRRFAWAVGAVDQPGARRVNTRAVPRMGGLAIVAGFVLAVPLVALPDLKLLGILVGGLIIAILGAADDLLDLRPWQKLLGQTLAAAVALRAGLRIQAVSNLFGPLPFLTLDALSTPMTLLWIVGCTNAVNLIDGLDGLAVGVSSIASSTMLAVALLLGEWEAALLLAALSGACLGFAPWNRSPASIFMGDVGAQFLGYVLAVSSILGLFKFPAAVGFLVPLLAMGLPLCDTVFAFVRRIAHGRSPFAADRGHLHHRLLAAGYREQQAVSILLGISALCGLLAILLVGAAQTLRVLCLTAIAVVLLALGTVRRS